jgi:hypothetical protein
LPPGIHSVDRQESLSIQNGKGKVAAGQTGLGGQRGVPGEAAGLRHGLGGFGEVPLLVFCMAGDGAGPPAEDTCRSLSESDGLLVLAVSCPAGAQDGTTVLESAEHQESYAWLHDL